MDRTAAKWGSQTADDWGKMQEFSATNGLIPGKLPVNEYFTNEFSDKSNQFDVAAIRKQAETFTPAMIKNTAAK
jgi:hypothetical protein